MTTATTTSRMGAAIAIFRRTARSCAAPLTCHAAQRSSNVAESVTGVDVGVPGGATTVATVLAMCPLTPEGFGEGWARMAEGSEKQDFAFYTDRAPSRSNFCKTRPFSVGFRRRICREQPIHVVREFPQTHSTCVWRVLGASRYRGDFDGTPDDQRRRDDCPCLSFQWIHHGLPLCLTREDVRRTGALACARVVTTAIDRRRNSSFPELPVTVRGARNARG
jgi:hypothetical protein